jgi:prepilin-type N-terminal cleavage/methylation domain-containing protein
MNSNCGFRISDFGLGRSRCAHSAIRGSAELAEVNPQSAIPHGLTLIELLVTIVIMVTVLAGVIPLISPNNNARKIREASRQLNSLLQQAQAQAARDGRPAGVAFREFTTASTNSGIALEAFVIANPRPFVGFSNTSEARLLFMDGAVTMVQFVLAGQFATFPGAADWDPNACYFLDPAPPNTIRFGDEIEVGGYKFVITDPDRDGVDPRDDTGEDENPRFIRGDYYTDARAQFAVTYVGDSPLVPRAAIQVRANEPTPLWGWTNPTKYTVIRQPAKTTDAPLQFPRGIGIDLQASGATGPGGAPDDFDQGGIADLTGVMFRPNGSLEAVYYNGERFDRVEQAFILLGLFANGNNGNQQETDYNFKDFPPPANQSEIDQRRSRINWLNPDAAWVTVTRAGRVLTSPNNTSFRPWESPYIDDPPPLPTDPRDRRIALIRRQIDGFTDNTGTFRPGARLYAQQLQQEGGR